MTHPQILPVDVPWVSSPERIEPYYSAAAEAITMLHRFSLNPGVSARNPVHYEAWEALTREARQAYELWEAARDGQQAGWKFLCAEMRHDGVEFDVGAPADPERFRRWGLHELADFVEEDNRRGRYVTTGFRLPWLSDHRPRSEAPPEPGPCQCPDCVTAGTGPRL